MLEVVHCSSNSLFLFWISSGYCWPCGCVHMLSISFSSCKPSWNASIEALPEIWSDSTLRSTAAVPGSLWWSTTRFRSSLLFCDLCMSNLDSNPRAVERSCRSIFCFWQRFLRVRDLSKSNMGRSNFRNNLHTMRDLSLKSSTSWVLYQIACFTSGVISTLAWTHLTLTVSWNLRHFLIGRNVTASAGRVKCSLPIINCGFGNEK